MMEYVVQALLPTASSSLQVGRGRCDSSFAVSLAGFRVFGFVGACGVLLSIKKQRFLLDHEFSKSPIYSDFTIFQKSYLQ
jgi:hypothetical protein